MSIFCPSQKYCTSLVIETFISYPLSNAFTVKHLHTLTIGTTVSRVLNHKQNPQNFGNFRLKYHDIIHTASRHVVQVTYFQ